MGKRKQQATGIQQPATGQRNRSPLGAAIVAVLLLAVGYCAWNRAPATAPAARPTNILLITLDTVRADRIGAYGYAAAKTPNLDSLARDGVRFDDAAAAAPITGPAHAALFTGRYPGRLGVRDNASTPLPTDATTLAQVLSGRGFATGGFIGAFILDKPYGFAKGFAQFDSGFTRVDSGHEANAERRGSLVVDDAVKWIASLPADRPFFAWTHLYDPHAAYLPPEPFATEFAGRPYDGEIAFVDQQIGRLLDALRARNALSRTLVIAIADHGESLGDHGEDEHGVFLYESVMRIPWIMSGPGLPRGGVIADQVRAVDLFPTLLEALGMSRVEGIDGESLVALLASGGGTKRPAAYAETWYPRLHYGWSELRSLRADGWKAIDAPRPELYNLKEDPAEQRNVYSLHRQRADGMLEEAARLDREMASAAPATAPAQPDPATLQRLRSLGYVGVVAKAGNGARGPDPKDRIAERREYRMLMSQAIDDLRARRPAEAVVKLKRLVEINQRAYDLHLMLGQAYEQQGMLAQALGEYELAAILNPDTANPLLSAAEIHIARNDTTAARKRLDEAARLEPNSFDVALVTGRVREGEGRAPEALAAYEKAAAINPANPRPRTLLVSLATRTRQFDLAEKYLRALLEMGYQPSRTHFGLGRIAEMRGRKDDAVRHYRTALDLEPGLPMARESLKRLGQ
jgi:arylsulfatase A-like enzyme/Tfp pilus assembly protein PilF